MLTLANQPAPTYYGTRDVAKACGIAQNMAARYFRRVNPKRHPESWTRLDRAEFDAAVAELRECLADCPSQPLHALAKRIKARGESQ